MDKHLRKQSLRAPPTEAWAPIVDERRSAGLRFQKPVRR